MMNESDSPEPEVAAPEIEKISAAALGEVLLAEISVSLGGRDATYLAPRIALCALKGRPNWGTRTGELPLSTLSAYNEALARVQQRYDLDDASHKRLMNPPPPPPGNDACDKN
jgi:hypothetical protein